MDLFLGVHVVSHDEGVTIPSVLQQPRNLRVTVVRGCWVAASGVCQVLAHMHVFLCVCACVLILLQAVRMCLLIVYSLYIITTATTCKKCVCVCVCEREGCPEIEGMLTEHLPVELA